MKQQYTCQSVCLPLLAAPFLSGSFLAFVDSFDHNRGLFILCFVPEMPRMQLCGLKAAVSKVNNDVV
jgi:hypothetical protein